MVSEVADHGGPSVASRMFAVIDGSTTSTSAHSLSRRDRSLVTLASLVTGGHDDEIGMHVRAAITNGVTRDEISETILHTSIYAGVPAANAAFAIAREVFAQLDDVD